MKKIKVLNTDLHYWDDENNFIIDIIFQVGFQKREYKFLSNSQHKIVFMVWGDFKSKRKSPEPELKDTFLTLAYVELQKIIAKKDIENWLQEKKDKKQKLIKKIICTVNQLR